MKPEWRKSLNEVAFQILQPWCLLLWDLLYDTFLQMKASGNTIRAATFVWLAAPISLLAFPLVLLADAVKYGCVLWALIPTFVWLLLTETHEPYAYYTPQ